MASDRVTHVQRILLGAFVLVGLNLARLQLVHGPAYQRLAEQNHLRLIPSSAPRGEILDRTGLVLAGNRPALHVVIVPQETVRLPETLDALATLLGTPAELLQRTYQARRTLPFAPVVVAEDVTRETALVIEERRHQLPGVFVQPHVQRVYPEGAAAAHVVGYVGDINADELAALTDYGYRRSDQVGKTGLERQYDAYLRGEPGGTMVEVDHRGRFVRLRGVREPAPGRTIQLTISAWLQRRAAELLGDARGACVILEARTGEVLALASSPSFDANLFLRSDPAPKRALLTSPDAPMLQRASGAAFIPGSIFKLVTATAALEDHRITPATVVTCGGELHLGKQGMRCWKRDGHGPEDLRLGLSHSCNVYFGQAGLWTGPEELHRWATLFGLGRATGIELPGEQEGAVPSPSRWSGEHWYAGHTAHLAIGQGGVLVTPLQAAVMMAAVANGGWLVHPHLVRSIGGVEMASPRARNLMVHPDTLAAIRSGLEAVINDPDGTGRHAHSALVRIAGKTGTAQTQLAGQPHAWFLGYAPSADPQIVVAVLLEHGGSGGDRPSDIGKTLIEGWWTTTQDAASGTPPR